MLNSTLNKCPSKHTWHFNSSSELLAVQDLRSDEKHAPQCWIKHFVCTLKHFSTAATILRYLKCSTSSTVHTWASIPHLFPAADYICLIFKFRHFNIHIHANTHKYIQIYATGWWSQWDPSLICPGNKLSPTDHLSQLCWLPIWGILILQWAIITYQFLQTQQPLIQNWLLSPCS